jgi:hypothetical protein
MATKSGAPAEDDQPDIHRGGMGCGLMSRVRQHPTTGNAEY